ncbi:MAG: NADH-quinone oxidoreductase subunit N, partial [Flavobacteriales bacterium]
MKEILIISLLGIVVLALDVLKMRKLVLPVTVIGLLGLIGVSIADWGLNEIPFAQYGGMLQFDQTALSFTIIFAFIALFWFILAGDSYSAGSSQRTDIFALVLFSLCGAVVLSAYTNLVMLFLGVEILSIPVYVLAASDRKNVLSNESGFKYFFLGSLASAILLFGISLTYGAVGSFNLDALQQHLSGGTYSPLALAGAALMLVGFCFKISVAPFHLWAPDVYQGAPTSITAYMATIVKGAAFAGMYKLFGSALLPLPEAFTAALVFMAGLTLIASNLMAVVQSNTKRMLAFSSISHAGFMLGFVLAASTTPVKYLIFYTLTYSTASLISFFVVQQVAAIQQNDDTLNAFKGLIKRSPAMAISLTVALLSMAGIPPLSGFLAKYYVISNMVRTDHMALVIIMILTSAIGAVYYLRVIAAVFTPIENAGRIMISDRMRRTMVVLSALLVVFFFA